MRKRVTINEASNKTLKEHATVSPSAKNGH